MSKISKSVISRLKDLAEKGINVLLTGAHGVGKTSIFYDLCEQLGLKGAYINVPSSDYFVDWLGIPHPETEPETIRTLRWFLSQQGGESVAVSYAKDYLGMSDHSALEAISFLGHTTAKVGLQFLRPKRLSGVQFVFFDEINREADPRFLDSCMEMVQFRRVNGQELPDLKLVWAAQNPPNDVYRVKELDIPLVDKFGAHIYLEGNPDYAWYCNQGYDPHTAASVISWYESDLNKSQKSQVSPRCLENLMRLADAKIDVEFALLATMQLPAHRLKEKLARASSAHAFANLDLATISSDPLRFIEQAKSNLDFCAYYTDLLREESSTSIACLKTIAVFMAMPFEFQSKCFTDVVWVDRLQSTVRFVGNLTPDVVSIPGFYNFVEMLNQFGSK